MRVLLTFLWAAGSSARCSSAMTAAALWWAVAAVEHRTGQQDHSKVRSSRGVSIGDQVVGRSATWASIAGLQVTYEELSRSDGTDGAAGG